MKGIAIPKADAKTKISNFLREGFIDRSHKIRTDGSKVYLPINDSAPVEGTIETQFAPRNQQSSPLDSILPECSYMGISAERIPKKWVRIGNAVILRYDGSHPNLLGEVFARNLHATSVYRHTGRISGKTRVPSLELIYGPGGSVVHRENGIRFRLDPEKVMFSPGNVTVRTSMKFIDAKGKLVFDMFAGIGYFCLPIAKYSHPRKIIAAEINPVAFAYLRQNVSANKVADLFSLHNADSGSIILEEKADIIIMGHFSSPQYLSHAVDNLKNEGIILLHHLVSSEKLGNVEESLKQPFRGSSKKVEVKSTKIKSFAPNQWHLLSQIKISTEKAI